MASFLYYFYNYLVFTELSRLRREQDIVRGQPDSHTYYTLEIRMVEEREEWKGGR